MVYNSLVHHHHYLGYWQIVGNHLKYIAYIGDRPVACLGWGSAAWSVLSRDSFIGWDIKTNQGILQLFFNIITQYLEVSKYFRAVNETNAFSACSEESTSINMVALKKVPTNGHVLGTQQRMKHLQK